MRKEKNDALKLRKTGKSYNEIRHLLRIPKSTLSDWLRGLNWSQKIKLQLAQKAQKRNTIRLRELNKIHRRYLSEIYKEARAEAEQEFEYFKFHPLFIAGVSIYWGEGDKATKHNLRISNVDPLMIKLFVKFLREICGMPKEKIRANLLLYPDLSEDKCKNFWIKKSGLSNKHFNKSIVIEGRHKTRRIPYGVCNVAATSTYLKEKMFIWLTLLPKEFIKNKYYKKDYYSRE